MKIKTKYLIIIILAFIFTGCSTDINLKDYIDKSAPFQININQTDTETGLTTKRTFELPVNSEKWIKLIDWTENNKNGWQFSLASYIADISIIQGDFKLLYSENSSEVVISFIDKQGKSRQFVKTISKGDLDFLTNITDDGQANPDGIKNKCEKCNIQAVYKVSENIENLTFDMINDFICTIDKSCSNNTEFSEWSNETLFKIIQKNPALYFKVLKKVKREKQRYILSEFENPVIEIDYQRMYDNIEKSNVEQELKTEYLNALEIIAKKYNKEIEK